MQSNWVCQQRNSVVLKGYGQAKRGKKGKNTIQKHEAKGPLQHPLGRGGECSMGLALAASSRLGATSASQRRGALAKRARVFFELGTRVHRPSPTRKESLFREATQPIRGCTQSPLFVSFYEARKDSSNHGHLLGGC
ncbi:hypothetical protein KSP40_PGU019419 [Platanthera guangdongensis]|uniref:Uncharacterized protein n=1 Tax=Platanthera guangdongensis TaxID=2320717 RepID=A0ABR2LT99_9ASPA